MDPIYVLLSDVLNTGRTKDKRIDERPLEFAGQHSERSVCDHGLGGRPPSTALLTVPSMQRPIVAPRYLIDKH